MVLSVKLNFIMQSFDKLHNFRRDFIKKNIFFDHVCLGGKNNVIISAPHGVSQIRENKIKLREVGSLTTALFLYNMTGSYLISKTRNNGDDANYDKESDYKKDLLKMIAKNKIRYLLDFHGLNEKREIDINLGTNFGKNIQNAKPQFEDLVAILAKNKFKVTIDSPFTAGERTISGSIKAKIDNIFTLQIEINSGITNRRENYPKYKKLLQILIKWIKGLN